MTPLSNSQVGDRIRKIREEKSLSQTEIAEYIGMTKSSYAKYERGERKRFDRELLLRISEALDVGIEEIIGIENLVLRESSADYSANNTDAKWLMDKISKARPEDISMMRRIYEAIDREKNEEGN